MDKVYAAAGRGVSGSRLAGGNAGSSAAGVSQAADRINVREARTRGGRNDGVFAVVTKHPDALDGNGLSGAKAVRRGRGDGGGARCNSRRHNKGTAGLGGSASPRRDIHLVLNERLCAGDRPVHVVIESDRQAGKYVEIGGADRGRAQWIGIEVPEIGSQGRWISDPEQVLAALISQIDPLSKSRSAGSSI